MIKTWLHRLEVKPVNSSEEIEAAMQAEIDELRAALAALVCPSCHAPGLLFECVHCSHNNYPFPIAKLAPMTDEQIVELLWVADHDDRGRRAVAIDFARAVEAHHGIRKQEPTDWAAS